MGTSASWYSDCWMVTSPDKTVGHFARNKEQVIIGVSDGCRGVTNSQVCGSGFAKTHCVGFGATNQVITVANEHYGARSCDFPEAGAEPYSPRPVGV